MPNTWTKDLSLSAGRHGGGAAGSPNESSNGDADRFRRMHDSARGRAHAGADDIHVYTAEHRGRL